MANDKLDLYALYADEYQRPRKPTLVRVRKGNYLAIAGVGAPDHSPFSEKMGVLYQVAYTLKFALKAQGRDFKVAAPEGLWWAHDPENSADMLETPPGAWHWMLIIRMPDFVRQKDVTAAVAAAQAKNPSAFLEEVRLEKIGEGLCVQMLHIGPYAAETETIGKMRAFAEGQHLAMHGKHHEIYLSDPRRVAPEKMKTLLRIPVQKAPKPM